MSPESVYRQLGVTPIINGCGTVTRLGGAPMPAAVLTAFEQAAREWVPLEQLQSAASARIAHWTGTEAGLVTTGSAGALTLGTAAILTGHDLGRMEQLPDCSGFANQIVVAREQRSGYDHAVRGAGARLVEVGFNEIVANAGVRRTEAWEYETAFTDQTAGILYGLSKDSQPRLSEVVEVAHRHDLPVLVDAAGELPPLSNLTSIAQTGADLIAFSGGKAIRGPQSTGILCGRRTLISAAALQMLDMDDHFDLWDPPANLIERDKLPGLPRHGIGRALKVSKEEIVALLTALDLFATASYDRELPAMLSRLQTIQSMLKNSQARCSIGESSHQRPPLLEVQLGGRARAFEVCRRLRQGTPPIYLGHGRLDHGILVINPLCLDDHASRVIGSRLAEELAS